MKALSLTASARAQIGAIVGAAGTKDLAIQIVRQRPVGEDLANAIASGATEEVIRDLAARQLARSSGIGESWLDLNPVNVSQCREGDLQSVGGVLFALPRPLWRVLDDHLIDHRDGQFSIVRADGGALKDPVRSLLWPELEVSMRWSFPDCIERDGHRLQLLDEGSDDGGKTLRWEMYVDGSWQVKRSITPGEFQHKHPFRRWVVHLHSLDPIEGTAIIRVAEGDRQEPTDPGEFRSTTFHYSWRRWDLSSNHELEVLQACETVIEPYFGQQ